MVDEDAVRALLAHADITEKDVIDPKRFGAQDELIARSFADSVRENPVPSRGDLDITWGPAIATDR